MNRVKLVAADMDHTLLTESGELPPGFYDYIDKLTALGIHFVVASGRPMYTLEQMFAEVLGKICIISDNGAMIKVCGRCIYSDEIPVDEYQKMIRFTIGRNAGIPVLCALDGAYVDAKYRQYEKTMSRFFAKINFVPDMEVISAKANKYTIFFSEYDAKKYLREMYIPQFGDRYSTTIGGEEWIDIMNHNINKGTAIFRLIEHFGITAEQTMAFGDTYNDIEMLRAVNYSYVMKNASDEMKQYGKYEADTNENYGVLKILDRLIAAQMN